MDFYNEKCLSLAIIQRKNIELEVKYERWTKDKISVKC